ncbi:MAG TPA: restriction endonuclease subunit S, partial [Bacteroidales bacterium]|nr:restriction endonuclease subunit S [Bacteroidales bacterium]
KMKESGDKYIGLIPKSWQIRRLKFLANIIFSNVDKHSFEEELRISLCNYVDVYKNDYIVSSIEFMKATASKSEIDKFSIQKDDIIVTKDSETYEDIAKPAIVFENLQNVLCGYHLAIIRCKSTLIAPKYLFYLFKSKDFNKQFAISANGITRYGLSQMAIKDAEILIPSLAEQKEIISLIDEKSRYINKYISSLQQQINLIKQYKSSLISEAVTGKIEIKKDVYNLKKTQRKANTYFKRTVLAAGIVSQLYQEPTFGHTKFVKLLFLSEKLAEFDIKTKYHRQAAGPYDNRALRSIDKQLEEHKWFKAVSVDGRIKYEPLENASEYRSWFDKYYSVEKGTIDFIVNTFKTAKTIQCEIVATLFSAWEDLLKENPNVSDNEIVNEVLNNWHESKKRIPKERWLKALKWMRSKDIKPV